MRATRTDSEESNGRRTTATYSCDTSGFGYSIITDDIKNDFNFLINELPQKLDNAMTELNNAAAIDNAFDFEAKIFLLIKYENAFSSSRK